MKILYLKGFGDYGACEFEGEVVESPKEVYNLINECIHYSATKKLTKLKTQKLALLSWNSLQNNEHLSNIYL